MTSYDKKVQATQVLAEELKTLDICPSIFFTPQTSPETTLQSDENYNFNVKIKSNTEDISTSRE